VPNTDFTLPQSLPRRDQQHVQTCFNPDCFSARVHESCGVIVVGELEDLARSRAGIVRGYRW
jgi:hypothetical protein